MINWRAVFLGVLVAVVVGLSTTALSLILQFRGEQRFLPYMAIGVRIIGILGKIAGGGVAGWIARRAGALHGGLAMSIAMVAGLVIGVCVTFGMSGSAAYLSNFDYWRQFVPWALLGIGIGAASGLVAEKART